MDWTKFAQRPVVLWAGAIGVLLIVFLIFVMPLFAERQQAEAERPRVQALVETVVAAEIEQRKSGAGYFEVSFGGHLPGATLSLSDKEAVADYAIEARQGPDGAFRIQAWPRPEALRRGRAAAVSYYVDLSVGGAIIDEGWVGSELDQALR
jgi:hypothetical protein